MDGLDARNTVTLVALGVSVLVMLLGLAAAWGSLRSRVKSNHEQTQGELQGVNARLDRINGRLDSHGERLDNQGQRIAHLEGSYEHAGD